MLAQPYAFRAVASAIFMPETEPLLSARKCCNVCDSCWSKTACKEAQWPFTLGLAAVDLGSINEFQFMISNSLHYPQHACLNRVSIITIVTTKRIV